VAVDPDDVDDGAGDEEEPVEPPPPLLEWCPGVPASGSEYWSPPALWAQAEAGAARAISASAAARFRLLGIR